MQQDTSYTASVVIPFYNEEGNVRPLLSEIQAAGRASGGKWELVLVDDCGTDGTPQILLDWAGANSDCRLVRMPGNQGQAAALYAGLRHASAPLIITMDGDGQNVPEDISALLAQLGEADMVVGIRAQRNDSWLRRRMSRFANRIRGWVLGDRMSDSGCALKVFRREVVDSLLPIRTLYSFMPAMAVAAGFTVKEHPVRHRGRTAGQSSYGLMVFLWRPLVDMMGLLWFRRRCLPVRKILSSQCPGGSR